jgi:hypothetical protein
VAVAAKRDFATLHKSIYKPRWSFTPPGLVPWRVQPFLDFGLRGPFVKSVMSKRVLISCNKWT